MSGAFIALGRAVGRGRLSACSCSRPARPAAPRGLVAAGLTAAGVVFGFPLLTSVAMRYVEAVHASVIVGVLPLATALVGACCTASALRGFWALRLRGSALVVAFALLRSGHGLRVQPADACCWPRWPAPPSATATARACRSACAPST
jgi:drug/metabolite transporter (DMT)-like permease